MNTTARAGDLQSPSNRSAQPNASLQTNTTDSDCKSPARVSRRNLLTALGPLAAAGAALPHALSAAAPGASVADRDRKSTRLNSSH